MKSFSLTHLADHVLLRELHTLVAQDRSTTATLLAHLGEVDERGLYRAKAYSSMHQFCVGELGMSEDAASRRIQVARCARKHPALFQAVVDGRLNISTVLLLDPHLTGQNVDELLALSGRKTKEQVRLLLAERFPRPDVPTLLQPVTVAPPLLVPAVTQIDQAPAMLSPSQSDTVAPPASDLSAPARIAPTASPMATEPARPRVTPLSPGRYALQVTVSQRTRDLLQKAKGLLAHSRQSSEVGDILERALQEFVERLERRKFGLGTRARRPGRGSTSARHIPAKLKRAVHARDGGRCTFQADNGRRCESTDHLEFDHVQPVARGGRTTMDNLRLRCRAHNQYEAERTYGAGFMQEKRGTSRGA